MSGETGGFSTQTHRFVVEVSSPYADWRDCEQALEYLIKKGQEWVVAEHHKGEKGATHNNREAMLAFEVDVTVSPL